MEGVVESAPRTPTWPARVPIRERLIDAVHFFVVLVVLDESLGSFEGGNLSHIRILDQAAVASLPELRLVEVILLGLGHFRRELILLTEDLRGTG